MAENVSHTPPRSTPGRGRIWLAAALAPLAWMMQGAGGWFIVAHACPSSSEPMSLRTARALIGLLSVVALIISIGGVVAATRIWRSLTTPEGEGRVLTAAQERVRFVATLALVVCVTISLGLVMAGLPSILIHVCGETR